MTSSLIADIAMLPVRLPGMIAAKVTPKVDLLTPTEKLDRRILWGGVGGVTCGSLAVLGFIGVGILMTGLALGFASASALGPALLLTAGSYTAATAAAVCNKTRLDCLVYKVMNDMIDKTTAGASAGEINEAFGVRPASAEPKKPAFNHVAATTLDKDITAMPAIRLATKRAATP